MVDMEVVVVVKEVEVVVAYVLEINMEMDDVGGSDTNVWWSMVVVLEVVIVGNVEMVDIGGYGGVWRGWGWTVER